jgi:hypothetical protein
VATIVCGIDDSPGAVEALRVARTLSTDLNLRLVLAHVAAGWNVAAGWTEGADESLSTNQARQGGDRLLERAVREHNLEAERRVELGASPATAVRPKRCSRSHTTATASSSKSPTTDAASSARSMREAACAASAKTH